MLSTRIHCHCRYLYHILEDNSNTTSKLVSGEDFETRPSSNEGETTRGPHKSRLYVCKSFFEECLVDAMRCCAVDAIDIVVVVVVVRGKSSLHQRTKLYK